MDAIAQSTTREDEMTVADYVAPIVDFRLKVYEHSARWRGRADLIAWVTEALMTLWTLDPERAEVRAERFRGLLHG